jgi:hypothetical protein
MQRQCSNTFVDVMAADDTDEVENNYSADFVDDAIANAFDERRHKAEEEKSIDGAEEQFVISDDESETSEDDTEMSKDGTEMSECDSDMSDRESDINKDEPETRDHESGINLSPEAPKNTSKSNTVAEDTQTTPWNHVSNISKLSKVWTMLL